MTEPQEKNGLRSQERTSSGSASLAYFSAASENEARNPITEATMRKIPKGTRLSTHAGAGASVSRSSERVSALFTPSEYLAAPQAANHAPSDTSAVVNIADRVIDLVT